MTSSQREHTILETDDVSGALAEAAVRWPELDTGQLLRRLVSEGGVALRASAARQAVIDLMIGCTTEE